MLFLLVVLVLLIPHVHSPGRDRKPGPPPEKGELVGVVCSEIRGTLLGERAGGRRSGSPKPTKSEQRERAPHLAPLDDKRQASGEISERGSGFTSDQHGWT